MYEPSNPPKNPLETSTWAQMQQPGHGRNLGSTPPPPPPHEFVVEVEPPDDSEASMTSTEVDVDNPSVTSVHHHKLHRHRLHSPKEGHHEHSHRGRCCRPERVQNTHFRLQEIRLPRWIKFIARFSLIWEFIIYILSILTFALVTYSASFTFYEEGIANLLCTMDVIFGCDMLLRLGVEIWRYKNQVTVVLFTSPYTMLEFLLDIISLIPFHQLYILYTGVQQLYPLTQVNYYKLNCVVRVHRMLSFETALREGMLASEKLMFLISFNNMYIIFIHLVACLLMYIVDVDALDFLLMRNRSNLDTTWMRVVNQNKYGYPTETPWQTYVISMNLATATVTTVGYGDISATNETEMVWCIIFMLVGAIFLNGFFTSRLTTFELEIDGSRFDLFFRVAAIRKYLTTVGTQPLFDAKVLEYYKYLWSYREGVYEVQFMQRLPPAFQEDLLFDICQEMFSKSFLFNGMDETLLRAIAKIVKVALYNPEMILCRKGDYANKLYYILQGECRVISKYQQKTAAILRVGAIIGEANLFFSYPYTATIETRTCCQFMILEKEELILAMDDFRNQLAILRSRSQKKILNLYDTHEIMGIPPVCWVVAKKDLDHLPMAVDIKKTMRWGSGFNKEVAEDVIDDTQKIVIFDTPCENKDIVKNHLTPYMTCIVPEIMDSNFAWMPVWNAMIMAVSMACAIMGPYCVCFGENSNFEESMCHFLKYFMYPISLIYMVDVFVEIIAAVPVYGIYYQFWDGLNVKKFEIMFYVDILSALPLGYFATHTQSPLNICDTCFKCLKLWKVIRYLHYMDNRHPHQLFWFRLTQTILVLVYGIHWIANISYALACRTNVIGDGEICANNSWLKSYEKTYEWDEKKKAPHWMRLETLKDNAAYLLSIFYSSATLTSAGFGDFSPQRLIEMIYAIMFQLIGFYLIGYYTSTLTSALACVVRPKLVFQQKLISVTQFMIDNHLSENLRDRIVEYFNLQNQLRGGVTLGKGISHIMYDCPEYLRNDVLYLEVLELLEGIPVFSKVESEVIIKMASFMKRILIPPNTTFLQRGEIRRVMYLIKQGSCGIFADDSDEPMNILEASSHFGVRDLLFGEPCHFTVKSLSNVCLYSIKLQQVQEAMAQDEEFWDFVEKERARLSEATEEMVDIYSKLVKVHKKCLDVPASIASWVKLPPRPKPEPEVKNLSRLEKQDSIGRKDDQDNHALLNKEYDDLFEHFRFGKLLKMFLMRRTVHPVGNFSTFWAGLTSVISFTTVVLMFIETFMSYRRPYFRVIQWLLDFILIVDIYVNMHWAYYTDRKGAKILISHPLKTCANYVMEGTFVLDALACTPLEMIIPMLGWTDGWGYGEGATWYTKLRWTRFLHIKRLFVIFEIAHTIFKHRNAVLLTLYVWATLFVCTLLGAVCLYTACPWEASFWTDGDEYRMPICMELQPNEEAPVYWATVKSGDAELISSPWDRWVLSVYYVSQVVLVIGFGDLISLRTTDLLMLTFMQVFGFILMRCVIADVTAAEVDADEIRTNFVESMSTLHLVMLRQGVDKKLIHSVMDHLNYTWSRSKGLQPRELFADLHPALESDVYRELVGKELANVALFRGFTVNLIRTLSSYLRKVYFRRGDRIMRCGNLENELRVITTGQVFICDMNYNYLCTLTAGDCFGESSMMLKARNRYNAVAMTNVEIYYLSSQNFDSLMERYSNLKDMLATRLRGGDRDYFEIGLEDKMDLTKAMTIKQKQGLIKSFRVRRKLIKASLVLRENMKSEIISIVPWYTRFRRMLVGHGTLDENLPILYFAKGRGKRGQGPSFNLLVHPQCPLMSFFNTAMIWLSYVTPAIATYETCFIEGLVGGVSHTVKNVSFGIEIIYLFHMLLKFFTPFKVSDGVFCKSHKDILVNYLLNPLGFWVDAFACIPVLVTIFGIAELDDPHDHTYTYLYLFKIIRLVKYYEFQFGRRYDISLSTFRFKMTISVTSFCLMAHMLACFFYSISPCKYLEDMSDLCTSPGYDTWTVTFKKDNDFADNREDFRKWKWWVRSLYWVVTTVSTTGFGDIIPYTVPEMGVAVICIFCGAFILSVILSDFTVGMASITKAYREYMYQVQLLVTHLRNIGLSKTRQGQVLMYFLTMWSRCRGNTSYSKATTILPICLQIEVCNAMFASCLIKIPYFRGHDEEGFIRQLCVNVIHGIYIPGICIVKEGDKGSSMFVVLKGLVTGTKILEEDPVEPEPVPDREVILPKPGHKRKPPAEVPVQLEHVYNVGDIFGRFPALFRDVPYQKSYRAESRVEVLEIPQDVIKLLAIKFPYFKRNMDHVIASRYASHNQNKTIFSKPRRSRNSYSMKDFRSEQRKSEQSKRSSGKSDPDPDHDEDRPGSSQSFREMMRNSHEMTAEEKLSRNTNLIDRMLHGEDNATGLSAFKEYRKHGESVFKDLAHHVLDKEDQDKSKGQGQDQPSTSKTSDSGLTQKARASMPSLPNKQVSSTPSVNKIRSAPSLRNAKDEDNQGPNYNKVDLLKKYTKDKKLKKQKQAARAKGKKLDESQIAEAETIDLRGGKDKDKNKGKKGSKVVGRKSKDKKDQDQDKNQDKDQDKA